MSIEQLLAYHCGPALTGLKPSNLVSCTKYRTSDVIKKNILLNKSCNTYGVYFHPIIRPKGSVLIFVYNKPLLEQTLKNPQVLKILDKEGYTPESSLEDKIKFLENKINSNPCFPHEIGLFLGYPVSDVEGFIKNKGENYKLCGYWKVYGNKKEARRLFKRYNSCRKDCLFHVTKGKPLESLCLQNTKAV